uniref:RNA helicase n=1 Tax=Physcomitrium patens TaxID=3218 RepID=A0A7I4EB43_PHYPA
MVESTLVTGSTSRYAPPDAYLPQPWIALIAEATGHIFYWNPESNITQYEKPLPLPPIGPGSLHELPAAPPPSRSSEPKEIQQATFAAAIEAYKKQHEVTVLGENVPAPLLSFEAAEFPIALLGELQKAGFSSPTPIQAQSWPIAMQSKDVVAVAKTGSGKTLGYLVPAFLHLASHRNNSRKGPTALVLAPTRELVMQIHDECAKFGTSSDIVGTCLYGGAPKGPQLRDIERGVDIAIATPGRLNDFLEGRKVSLKQVSYLVLDEADRMLDMGFEPQIRKIVENTSPQRQTLMYTATWPRKVRRMAADFLSNPVQVSIGNVDEFTANKAITQANKLKRLVFPENFSHFQILKKSLSWECDEVYPVECNHVEVVESCEKQRRLVEMLRSQEKGSRIIIFCSTKRACDTLTRCLGHEFGAAAIHGDKSQDERESVLSHFRNGRTPVLVATDVAARGLDVKDIRVVVNYDFPSGIDHYVHRIGRTGRGGATGVAYTLFSTKDGKYANALIKILEGANQIVLPELRDMASSGGGSLHD